MCPRNTHHTSILLIEDNPGDALLLQEILADAKDRGFKLEYVDTLSKGLERLARGGIDVVALDLGLPDSQGLETLSKLHAQWPEVPIVVVAGLGDDTVALQAAKEYAQEYVVKGEIGGTMAQRAIRYAVAHAEARAALQAGQATFIAMVEENPDGIMIVDKDNIVLYANPAVESFLGRAKEEVIGVPFDYPIATEETLEIPVIHRNGPIRYGELRVAEMDWNNTTAHLVSIRDITRRRRAEEALKAANVRLKQRNERLAEMTETAERFVDTVSHEFRTPLAVIKEFISILSDGLGGPVTKDQTNYLGIVSNAVLDLSKMVDDLLDTSRLRAGTLRVRRRRCTVAEIAQSVRPMLASKAAAKNITLVEVIAPALSDVFADKEKAGRVLTNLLVNAIKFSPANSQITIKATETPDQGVEISVTDEGPGLSRDELTVIFERFRQVGVCAEASAKGFGLGLSIARDLASLNLGQLRVESAPGKGSSFSFTLPRYDWREIVRMYTDLLPDAEGGLAVSGLEATLLEQNGSLDLAHIFLTSVCRPTDLILGDKKTNRLVLLGQTDTPTDWAARLSAVRVQSMKNDPLLRIPEIGIAVVGAWRCPAQNDKVVSWALEELSGREPLAQESACS